MNKKLLFSVLLICISFTQIALADEVSVEFLLKIEIPSFAINLLLTNHYHSVFFFRLQLTTPQLLTRLLAQLPLLAQPPLPKPLLYLQQLILNL